jgi:hypothetical protein
LPTAAALTQPDALEEMKHTERVGLPILRLDAHDQELRPCVQTATEPVSPHDLGHLVPGDKLFRSHAPPAKALRPGFGEWLQIERPIETEDECTECEKQRDEQPVDRRLLASESDHEAYGNQPE